MKIVREGWFWAGGALGVGVVLAVLASLLGGGGRATLCLAGGGVGFLFMLFFFRDPERRIESGPDDVLSGADGVIRAVEIVPEARFPEGNAVRISTFLSPLHVHINRSPIAGTVQDVAYVPGRHLLTLRNQASEHNEHSTIFITSDRISCLVRQIVGPVVRRVVHWLRPGQTLAAGDRIGLMKFGSRLDVHLPVGRVEVMVRPGQSVQAGRTVIARILPSSGGPEVPTWP